MKKSVAIQDWLTPEIRAKAKEKWNEHSDFSDTKRSEAIRIIQLAAKAFGIIKSTKQCTRLLEQHCL